MKVDARIWLKRKEEAYAKLKEDLEIGYLDEDIIDVLEEIFKRNEAFTVSSCSGRIAIVDSQYPWERKDSTVLFKKHQPIALSEIIDIINQPAVSAMWLVVVGPIIHVSTLTLREAFRILKIAREAGFKHSGILSASRKGITVELRTGIRLAVLLKVKNELVINYEKLEEIIGIANKALMLGKVRLKKLLEVLKSPALKEG